MTSYPLMPKATAIWLIDNTVLSFEQIADFCGLHILEIQAIADGESSYKMQGLDPLTMGQLTREELEKGEKDPNYRLQLSISKIELPKTKQKVTRYTPLSKRQDRPNAILWLLRYHPELSNSQISHLLGTTKTTIDQIRERTHWNSANLVPIDPVSLGLTTQIDLDYEIKKARKNLPEQEISDTLLPSSATENLDCDPINKKFPSTLDEIFSKPKKEKD